MREALHLVAIGLSALATLDQIQARIVNVHPANGFSVMPVMDGAALGQQQLLPAGDYESHPELLENRELQNSGFSAIVETVNIVTGAAISIEAVVTITSASNSSITGDFDVTLEVDVGGNGVGRFSISLDLLNNDQTAICDDCTASVVAGACIAGLCADYDVTRTNQLISIPSSCKIVGDPHMVGLLGQKIDWAGVDNGWYCLFSDGPDFHVNVRLSAPMPEEFPDRQLVSAVSILTDGGRSSLVVEVKNPYSTDTDGCPTKDSSPPCLADGGLRILVDGKESAALQTSTEKVRLSGKRGSSDIVVSAANLPAECRPFGGDRIWAAQFAEMATTSRNLRADSVSFYEWILQPEALAAPTWCAKFLEEGGPAGLLSTRSEHATFRVETPNAVVRINIGVNYQDLETSPDGTVTVPELEFWQTDLGFDRLQLSSNVAGLLGDTSRFVLDDEGVPVTSGLGALHGPVDSYRVAGPFAKNFENLHG